MKNAHKRWVLGASLLLVAGGLLATVTPVASGAPASANACAQAPRQGHIAGIVPAVGSNCPISNGVLKTSDQAKGTPPLLFNGGSVMMTQQTGPLVITPIFWEPRGYPMAFSYQALLTIYLGDVALASGQNSNVFSVLNEYFGTNGQVHYNMRLGLPVIDVNPLPPSGCTVASTDTANIYADGSGYTACLDDDQLQAELTSVTSSRHLATNLSHIYILYTPKHVESCFFPGSTTTNANACTINYQPSAAYCAYHSEDFNNGLVYANMPFPIYESKTNFTCGSEVNFGVLESPNHNPDADVEISPTSHETSEAVTDPDTMTGWFDSSGFEIGDECAYVYGTPQGSAGALWNQDINGLHFLTQEEFSNKDFAITGGGCVQAAKDEA